VVAYGSGIWVRTHNTWVFWQGHDMVHMLLTGHTVRVCQYWTYERGQEGDVPGLGLTDRDIDLLRGGL
jgi:hypothetical protein